MKCSRRSGGVRRGFTLLELLTVIAIISVLVAILLPSLSGARGRSRITQCQANLRELSAATLRYVSRHDDMFPVAADCSGGNCVFWNGHQYFGWNGTQPNPHGNVWARPLNVELGLEASPASSGVARVAECPSDGGAAMETGVSNALFDVLGSSYPLNPILAQGRHDVWRYRPGDLNLSQVLQPSRKVLVSDHVAFGLTFDAAWTAISPGWHDETRPAAVVGFVDGHADYLTGAGRLKEWQWYPEASGPSFTRQLTEKVDWEVLPGCE